MTSFRITAEGKSALERYWRTLRDLRPGSEPRQGS